jgi:hypothetical protein
MLPLPDAPAVAPAADEEGKAASFASLPPPLVRDIFARLPADARARAKVVSTGFRDTLTDVSLWTRLDLSAASGVTCTVNDAAMRGASGFARGGLTVLNVSGCADVTDEALLAVATANAGALRELHPPRVCRLGAVFGSENDDTLATETLLRAAPLLSTFPANVVCTMENASMLLRNEPPYEPLRIQALTLAWWNTSNRAAVVAAFTDNFAAHALPLSSLTLPVASLHEPGALDAVVDAAMACRLRSCTFIDCCLSPTSAPALARLLGSDALTQLFISGSVRQLLDEGAAVLVGDALRANSTLTTLSVTTQHLFSDSAALAALLGALTAHPSVRSLTLHDVCSTGDAAGGDLFAALVAANAPALTKLDVSALYGNALHALVHALPRNTHLRTLRCPGGSGALDTFVHDMILPAVRANKSLRSLWFAGIGAAHQEVEALVEARACSSCADAR